MRIVAIFLFLMMPAWVQAQSHQPKEDKTKIEIQKLFSDLNEAITKHDRGRLEQLYADEFQFIRPSGAVINKSAQISGIMANDPMSSTPVPFQRPSTSSCTATWLLHDTQYAALRSVASL